MKFEVPQFIEVEDKIFGPFTWKQFIFIAGGVGAAFMLYVLLPFFLFVLFAGPVMGLAAGLAFYKHNNRPFAILVESIARYMSGTRLYLWKKKAGTVTREAEAPAPTYTPPTKGSNVASLARQLEINALKKK